MNYNRRGRKGGTNHKSEEGTQGKSFYFYFYYIIQIRNNQKNKNKKKITSYQAVITRQ